MPVRRSEPAAAASGFQTAHWPLEIRLLKADRALEIDFDDGATFHYPAEFLRVESPSAEVQGHGPGQKVLVTGRRDVGILALEPVGNYAVRIRFDDLHDTGIFSWAYLYEIGRNRQQLWANYEAAMTADGKSRDPRG